MSQHKLPKEFQFYLKILNQIFEIEKKLNRLEASNSIARNLNRIKDLFESNIPNKEDFGFFLENPLGQVYDDRRIDLDATISGEGIENLEVIEVIKPIIRLKQRGFNQLVQKGVVIVQSKN